MANLPDEGRAPVALVTGAASGIGAAVAERLETSGFLVWSLDRRSLPKGHPGHSSGRFLRVDVSDSQQVATAVEQLVATDGRLDAVAACAGVSFRGSLFETPLEEWDRVMAINVRSVFVLAKASAAHLSASGSGAFVAIASELGIAGSPGLSAYGVSKAGVIHLMKVLALEFAEAGVRFNAVAPGATRTPMLVSDQASLGEPPEAAAGQIPMGRLAEPAEIAAVVHFALSPAAAFVTGTVLVADGGYTAR